MIHYFYWAEPGELHGYGAWTTVDGRIYRVFGEENRALATLALLAAVCP